MQNQGLIQRDAILKMEGGGTEAVYLVGMHILKALGEYQ